MARGEEWARPIHTPTFSHSRLRARYFRFYLLSLALARVLLQIHHLVSTWQLNQLKWTPRN